MSAYVLILLTIASLCSGLWGLYRDLVMPMSHGGLDCLCGIYLTTTCLFALPPLADSLLKILFGCFLTVRSPTGWIASQRVLMLLMTVQGLMIPIGIGFQYRLISQAGQPVSTMTMPALVLALTQLFLIGLGWMILTYLRSPKIKQRFAGKRAPAPVNGSASQARM